MNHIEIHADADRLPMVNKSTSSVVKPVNMKQKQKKATLFRHYIIIYSYLCSEFG